MFSSEYRWGIVLLILAIAFLIVAILVTTSGQPTPKSLCQSHHGIEWVRTGPEHGEETVLCRDGHGYRLLPNE